MPCNSIVADTTCHNTDLTTDIIGTQAVNTPTINATGCHMCKGSLDITPGSMTSRQVCVRLCRQDISSILLSIGAAALWLKVAEVCKHRQYMPARVGFKKTVSCANSLQLNNALHRAAGCSQRRVGTYLIAQTCSMHTPLTPKQQRSSGILANAFGLQQQQLCQ